MTTPRDTHRSQIMSIHEEKPKVDCPYCRCSFRKSLNMHFGTNQICGQKHRAEISWRAQLPLDDDADDDNQQDFDDDNQEQDFGYDDGNMDIQVDQSVYTGPIPYIVRDFELRHQTSQKESTLSGALNPPERSQAYIHYQKSVISEVFDSSCLSHVVDGNLGAVLLQLAHTKKDPKIQSYTYLHDVQMNASSSDASMNRFLKTIQMFKDSPTLPIPTQSKTIRRWSRDRISRVMPPCEIKEVSYPKHWKTELWKICPEKVVIVLGCPIWGLALKLLDPRCWCQPWRTSTKYDAYENSSEFVNHYMSGKMAATMENRKRNKVARNVPGWRPSDKMIGITYYEDGCSPCDHSRFSVEVIMQTYFGFSPEMQQKPWTKICNGYINNGLRNISKDEVIEMLITHGGYKTQTSALSEYNRFMTHLSEVSRKHFKKAISYCYHVGVEIMIPGMKKPVVVRTYLAAVNADKPAMCDIMARKAGQCIKGCHLCTYGTKRNSVVYDPTKQLCRDHLLEIQMQALLGCVRRFKLTRNEIPKNIIDLQKEITSKNGFITQWGLREHLPAFYGTPIAYDAPEDFYKCCIRDIFHDLDAGIFPAILTDSLRMIRACCRQREGSLVLKRELNNVNSATSASRLNKYPPYFKHVDFFFTWKGVVDMILGTVASKANKGSTGNSGSLRSSWIKGLIDKTLIAIGDGNDILPNVDDFTIKLSDEERVVVKNPARIVCSTLYASLDLYYDIMRNDWNPDICDHVRQKVRRLQTLHVVLHQNVVAVTRTVRYDDEYEVSMGKLHSLSHLLDNAMLYGHFSQNSCQGRETTHKQYVTAVVALTSQREITRSLDLHHGLEDLQMNMFDSFANTMREIAITTYERSNSCDPQVYEEEFYKALGPKQFPDRFFAPVKPKFNRGHNSKVFPVCSFEVDHLENLMKPSWVAVGYAQRLKHAIGSDIFEAINGSQDEFIVHANIINSMTVKASKFSHFHDDIIYCQPNDKKCSFVKIANTDQTVGRVTSITQLVTKQVATGEVVVSYFIDLLILEKDLNYVKPDYFPWDQYKWNSNFIVKMFPTMLIEDIMWIEPRMACLTTSIVSTNPNDCYWMRPRLFYERNMADRSYEYCEAVVALGETVDSAKTFIEENVASKFIIEENVERKVVMEKFGVDIYADENGVSQMTFELPLNAYAHIDNMLREQIYS